MNTEISTYLGNLGNLVSTGQIFQTPVMSFHGKINKSSEGRLGPLFLQVMEEGPEIRLLYYFMEERLDMPG